MCVCVSLYLPTHPAFSLPKSQQSCHLPSHFASRCWQPSISVSITLPASPARCLHYLTNDIMPFCVRASACSPTRPSPRSLTATFFLSFFFFHPRLPPSLHPSVCPFRLSLPRCRVSLHINRTLVTAFSASSCLLSASRCSVSSTYLHAPTLPRYSLFLPPSVSVFLFSHHLTLPPLCPSCPLNPPRPPRLSELPPVSVIQTLLPSVSILPPSPPFLSCSPNHLKLRLLPVPPYPLDSSVPLFLPCYLSSLSISLSAVDGGAGCRPKTRRG